MLISITPIFQISWYLVQRHWLKFKSQEFIGHIKQDFITTSAVTYVTNGITDFVKYCIKRWLHLDLRPSKGARCSSVVRAFPHGAMGHRIDPSGSGPIELFRIPVSAPRLV